MNVASCRQVSKRLKIAILKPKAVQNVSKSKLNIKKREIFEVSLFYFERNDQQKRRSDMNGYRSTLAGGGGVDNAGDYTFTLVNGGERSYVNGSCRGMFDGNTSINTQILIGRAVNTCAEMLNGCTSFNQNLDLHGEIVNCYKMLCGCTSFAKNLYFHSRTKAINTVGLLENTSNSRRKNVWFQPSMNTYFNNTDASSIVGKPITWTGITNGYYNAAYNVYCYYNFAN